ncbi:hypothetical protein [Paraburkholderia strydomiana]|uniref:hypothetical protein n=1 Tax=Paraburkholderia strydomiana TaxID=1245417 RepID=UPI002867A0A2|nr:hypothetical protein [Paraburkholderia strydomiana]MDR7009827.1 hypothetical protein [Paraburkholderia strydomiana]
MTIDFSKVNGVAGTSATSGSTSVGASSSNKPSFQSLLAELTDYVKGTPGERMEKMILAKLGVTEEELKKMSPEEREKILAKVREMLKKEMEAQREMQQQKASGQQINVSV